MEINNIFTESSILQERTPDDLKAWVEKMHSQLKQDEHSRKLARLRKGLAKQFLQEICILSLFASKLYAGRKDILCCPNLGNENYDAIIVDLSQNPPSETKVEITATHTYEKSLRMEYLNEHGHVWLTGELEFEGNKRSGHNISISTNAVDHLDRVQSEIELIQERIEKKCRMPYTTKHILLVGFDDSHSFYHPSDPDFVLLEEFSKGVLMQFVSVFQSIYLVGQAGMVMLSVK